MLILAAALKNASRVGFVVMQVGICAFFFFFYVLSSPDLAIPVPHGCGRWSTRYPRGTPRGFRSGSDDERRNGEIKRIPTTFAHFIIMLGWTVS